MPPSVTATLAITNPIISSKSHVPATPTLSGNQDESKFEPRQMRWREDCSLSSLPGSGRSHQDNFYWWIWQVSWIFLLYPSSLCNKLPLSFPAVPSITCPIHWGNNTQIVGKGGRGLLLHHYLLPAILFSRSCWGCVLGYPIIKGRDESLATGPQPDQDLT